MRRSNKDCEKTRAVSEDACSDVQREGHTPASSVFYYAFPVSKQNPLFSRPLHVMSMVAVSVVPVLPRGTGSARVSFVVRGRVGPFILSGLASPDGGEGQGPGPHTWRCWTRIYRYVVAVGELCHPPHLHDGQQRVVPAMSLFPFFVCHECATAGA